MDNNPQSPAPLTSDSQTPITDSPWFWLFLFGGFGIIAVAAIAPKYFRRQADIERQYMVREAILERQAKGTAPDRDAPAADQQVKEPASQPQPGRGRGLLIPLAPVAYVIAILLSIALLARVVVERRRAARQAPASNEQRSGRR